LEFVPLGLKCFQIEDAGQVGLEQPLLLAAQADAHAA
jgi:hypothetical protein